MFLHSNLLSESDYIDPAADKRLKKLIVIYVINKFYIKKYGYCINMENINRTSLKNNKLEKYKTLRLLHFIQTTIN